MKVSTKNKVLEVLKDHLSAARQKKSSALSKLRSCEENIRWGKKGFAKKNQILSQVKSFVKDCPDMEGRMVDSAQTMIRENNIQLRKDRASLKTIRAELSQSKNEIRKWNDLINEVSPYKK